MTALRRARAARTCDERGLAALELALTLGVLLAVLGLAVPLPLAMLEKMRLEQAANRTVRWATSVPAGVRPLPRGTGAEAADEAVRREAADALALTGSDAVLTAAGLTESTSPHCPLRRTRSVLLQTRVDLGALGVFVDAVRPGPGTGAMTLTARATACEE